MHFDTNAHLLTMSDHSITQQIEQAFENDVELMLQMHFVLLMKHGPAFLLRVSYIVREKSTCTRSIAPVHEIVIKNTSNIAEAQAEIGSAYIILNAINSKE